MDFSLDSIGDSISSAFDSAGSAVSDAASYVGDTASSAFDSASSAISDTASYIGDTASSAFDSVANSDFGQSVSGAVNDFGTAASDFGQSFGSAVSDFGSAASDFGSGVASGIGDTYNAISQGVSSTWGDVNAGVHDFGNTLQQGYTDGVNSLGGMITDVAGADVGNAFTSGAMALEAPVQQAAQFSWGVTEGALEGTGNLVNGVANLAGDGYQYATNSDYRDGVNNAVSNFADQAWNDPLGTAGNIANGVGNIANNVWQGGVQAYQNGNLAEYIGQGVGQAVPLVAAAVFAPEAEVGEAAGLLGDATALTSDAASLTRTATALTGDAAAVTGDAAAITGDAATLGGQDMMTVYRGTNRYLENSIFDETGNVLSDAGQQAYMSTGSLDDAYASSAATHQNWVDIWGGENNYAQAHGAFGTELSPSFGLDRTWVSVTTDPDIAASFANGGTVYSGQVPLSSLVPQTLDGAGESEYLLRNGTNLLNPISQP